MFSNLLNYNLIIWHYLIMNRNKKIEMDLQREISFIISTKVKDPRVGFVTITYVKLSPDHNYMDIYMTVMNKEANLKKSLEGLNKCKGFIKKNLVERVKLKAIPEIKFFYDESVDKGIRIDEILENLKIKEGKS